MQVIPMSHFKINYSHNRINKISKQIDKGFSFSHLHCICVVFVFHQTVLSLLCSFLLTQCMKAYSLLLLSCCRTACTHAQHAAAPALTTLIWQLMGKWKRRFVWSYFRAVNENVAYSDVCRKVVHCCGNTTNLFKYKTKIHEKENFKLQQKRRKEEWQNSASKTLTQISLTVSFQKDLGNEYSGI